MSSIDCHGGIHDEQRYGDNGTHETTDIQCHDHVQPSPALFCTNFHFDSER